ncbi:MAG: TadE/TadG family type IV pilus assembly protein [Terracidiphilus sp.]
MKRQNRCRRLLDERGSSLVELAMVLPVFMLLLLGAVDFGRAYYLSMEIAGAAHAAAVYGSQNPTDTAGMQSAALKGAPNAANLSVSSATYGCECSDGSNYSASCSAAPACTGTTQVYRVNVTVTAPYKVMFPWPGIPSEISLSSSASMRSAGS